VTSPSVQPAFQDIRNVSERPKGLVHKDIRTVSDVTECPKWGLVHKDIRTVSDITERRPKGRGTCEGPGHDIRTNISIAPLQEPARG
jgi:hypothetical protein